MKYFILAFCAVVSAQSLAQASKPRDQQLVQQVVEDVFTAFSNSSIQQMEMAVTADVKILEHGEVWTLDSIRNYFSNPRPADFKRTNHFEFFQTEVSKDMAFVSYWNTAEIIANTRQRNVKWLESAVLVKVNGQWRVQMLHSTRVVY